MHKDIYEARELHLRLKSNTFHQNTILFITHCEFQGGFFGKTEKGQHIVF